jgi:hypothetical protein
MRPLFFPFTVFFVLLSLFSARPALADFADAAGYWKLLGQQNQVPRLMNLRGTEDFPILEVVGDCEGALCSWGATRADLIFDGGGRVVRWQATLENGADFHEFDAFLVNGEIVMDYTGEIAALGGFINATLIFARASEEEIAAIAAENGVQPGPADTEDPLPEVDPVEEDPVADAGDAGGSGPSLEEQIVTGGLILGGLLLLDALLGDDGNGGNGGNAQPVDPNDTCGMTAVKPYIGRSYLLIPPALIGPGDRVVPESAPVTMDLIPSRLNVVYRDVSKKVFKVGCY